jgi:hypothetical protein
MELYLPNKNQTEIRPMPFTLLSRKYKILWKSAGKFWIKTRVDLHKNLSLFLCYFPLTLRAWGKVWVFFFPPEHLDGIVTWCYVQITHS